MHAPICNSVDNAITNLSVMGESKVIGGYATAQSGSAFLTLHCPRINGAYTYEISTQLLVNVFISSKSFLMPLDSPSIPSNPTHPFPQEYNNLLSVPTD